MGGSHYERTRLTRQTHDFSEGAEIHTRGRVCSPVEIRVKHPHQLGFLHPVIQFQIREAAAATSRLTRPTVIFLDPAKARTPQTQPQTIARTSAAFTKTSLRAMMDGV